MDSIMIRSFNDHNHIVRSHFTSDLGNGLKTLYNTICYRNQGTLHNNRVSVRNGRGHYTMYVCMYVSTVSICTSPLGLMYVSTVSIGINMLSVSICTDIY